MIPGRGQSVCLAGLSPAIRQGQTASVSYTDPTSGNDEAAIQDRAGQRRSIAYRAAGASGQLTMRADSGFYNHAVVAACRALDVRFSVTIRQQPNVRTLIEAIPQEDWTPIPYWLPGGAAVAETTYTPFRHTGDASAVRLIVRRVQPTPGSQLALFATYSYHAFITDRAGELMELEAGHRRHAEIENAIRDLKYGVGLNHLPRAASPRTRRGSRCR